METEEYRQLWKEAIHLCEIELNEEEATSFVWRYHRDYSVFGYMDDKTLLLTFVGLVVYEHKFHMKFGSTTPAAFCYQELLARANNGRMDREFIYDVGDWAADYSDNDYVPMGNCHGYGPRRYFNFCLNYQLGRESEQEAKKERLERLRAEGRAKVEVAKRKHQERLDTIQQLREMGVDECISFIEKSGKSVFYFIELIEELFKNNSLNEDQKEKLLSMFPTQSTRHNIRLRKYFETL